MNQSIAITGISGIALMTGALFALYHPEAHPQLPLVLNVAGLMMLALCVLIITLRVLMHR